MANNIQVTVDAEDPQVGMRVAGPLMENLHAIQGHYKVSISEHKSPEFTITGPQKSVNACEKFMLQLIKIAKTEEPDLGKVNSLMLHEALPARVKQRGGVATITTKKGRKIEGRTPAQSEYMKAMTNPNIDMVFGVGPAGTGKTYAAVAHAATLLVSGAIKRLIITRPAVEAGERLGFLPGDLKDKVDPYLRPIYDALYDTMDPAAVETALGNGTIEVAPLAFMRGRTLHDCIAILDEGQNTTVMQMKMFLTRLGDKSKMIITGDPSQIDLPAGTKSGLIDAIGILDGIKGIHITRFDGADVVRHPLVGRIVNAYDKQSARKIEAPSEPEIPLPEAVLDRGTRPSRARRTPASAPS